MSINLRACMIRSLELMSSFHAMCECDTWDEISRKMGKTRQEVWAIVSELELLLDKRLVYRRAEDTVASQLSSRFFIPTDSGMRWYLLIGEFLSWGGSDFEHFFTAACLPGGLNDVKTESVTGRLTSTVLVVYFLLEGTMKNLRIFSHDFLSLHFLEPVLAQLLYEGKILNFEILTSACEYLSDFDAYFLSHEIPVKDFKSEMMLETRLGLYASSDYLARLGEPKKLDDLLVGHNIIRCKGTHAVRALGVKKFGTIKDYVPLFHKQESIEVDSCTSQIRLAEVGAGITPLSDSLYKRIGPKLLRIPSLEDEEEFVYRKYTFGYHEKYSSDLTIKRVGDDLRGLLWDNA